VHSLTRLLSALCVAALLSQSPASAADIRVMISAGFHGVYSDLAPAFERVSGHHLITTRGPSMGILRNRFRAGSRAARRPTS
jgi:molybdate transport system substrate-binding protein